MREFPFPVTGRLSLPAWGEWIEMVTVQPSSSTATSLPAWGEWIEMNDTRNGLLTGGVSPRMGGSGLKSQGAPGRLRPLSLSPHGESGLNLVFMSKNTINPVIFNGYFV